MNDDTNPTDAEVEELEGEEELDPADLYSVPEDQRLDEDPKEDSEEFAEHIAAETAGVESDAPEGSEVIFFGEDDDFDEDALLEEEDDDS